MDRRSFLKMLTGFPLLALPLRAIDAGDDPSISGVNFDDQPWTPEQLVNVRKIKDLELQLQNLNGEFSWSLHSELRYCYANINEARSAYHADVILAHSVMDETVLSALSDWYFSPDPKMFFTPNSAIQKLLHGASLHPKFLYLRIASLIRAGEIYQHIGQTAQAQKLYQRARTLCQQIWEPQPILHEYERLVQAKLSNL